MNRKQRRKAGKMKFSVKEVEALEIQARKESIQMVVSGIMAVSALTLRDTFDFGAKRLEKYLSEMYEMFDAVENDYLNFDDIKKTLLEETGVEIR